MNAIKKEENKPILDSTHIKALEELLSDMKYGSITLIIQDGKMIQIDKTEKLRIRD